VRGPSQEEAEMFEEDDAAPRAPEGLRALLGHAMGAPPLALAIDDD
jgi:hypothetical protein